jgi:hypothetical protein
MVPAEDRPMTTAFVTCSTCDGYELVPNPADGGATLIACPDCPSKVRCPVHGRIVYAGERCRDCHGEALAALPLMVIDLLIAKSARAVRAAQPIERSVA